MGHYKANSNNAKNFSLTFENQRKGELIYTKWYSFNAEIVMPDGTKYQLKPSGFWDSKIELKNDTETLLEFKMSWKGIMIKTFFENENATYLLKLSGLFNNKFVLIDTDKNELMVAETDFKWSKLNWDYTIETTNQFDNISNKELLLLTILHCINYYMTMVVSAG